MLEQAGGCSGPAGAPLRGSAVVSWLQRGPKPGWSGPTRSGLLADTVRSLLADCVAGRAPDGPQRGPRGSSWPVLAHARGVLPVTYADWLRVEQAEMDGLATWRWAAVRGVKLASREAIDAACRPPRG